MHRFIFEGLPNGKKTPKKGKFFSLPISKYW
jgi:hypothetical protein